MMSLTWVQKVTELVTMFQKIGINVMTFGIDLGLLRLLTKDIEPN